MNTKRKKYISLFIILIGICIIIFFTSNTFLKHSTDLTGKNTYWKVSLNISPSSNSVLIVNPRRDDFILPTKMQIELLKNNKVIYKDNLMYKPYKSGKLGSYKTNFSFNSSLFDNYNNLNLRISYDSYCELIQLKNNLSIDE